MSHSERQSRTAAPLAPAVTVMTVIDAATLPAATVTACVQRPLHVQRPATESPFSSLFQVETFLPAHHAGTAADRAASLLTQPTAALFSSYDLTLRGIEDAVEVSRQIMAHWHELVLEIECERTATDRDLCDALAENKSLRRKDFESMISGVAAARIAREKEVGESVIEFLAQQKSVVEDLRQNLAEVKETLLSCSESARIEEFRLFMKTLLIRQELRRREVAEQLSDFQAEQRQLSQELRAMLSESRRLRLKDVKAMLRHFAENQRMRLAARNLRREEVLSMLSKFRGARRTEQA